LPTVKKSLAMRGLSSQLLMALVRKYDLNAEQRATLRSILLKDAPKDDESSSLRAMARDHEYVSDMVRQSPLKQDGEKMEKTSADLKEALDKMSLPTPGKRFAQSDEYEKSAAEAAKYYQASQAYSFPMRQVLVHENIALAMERMCVLATLVLDANEAAEDGHADDEAIAALAKEFPNQLLDPFTDNPLVVVNKGGKQFAIVSAGPDMKLSAPRRWAPYTPAMGPNGAGDVILYRIALPGSEKVSAEPAVDPEEALVEPAAEPAAEDDATAASGENPAAEAP
jgi:hypothetical protein